MIIKYRIVIITASLAIIISFPILMGTMGLPIALAIYVSAILLLIWYFIRATRSQEWYLHQGAASASDEVYVSHRFIDMTKIQTVGDVEDAIWPKERASSIEETVADALEADFANHTEEKQNNAEFQDYQAASVDEQNHQKIPSEAIHYLQEPEESTEPSDRLDLIAEMNMQPEIDDTPMLAEEHQELSVAKEEPKVEVSESVQETIVSNEEETSESTTDVFDEPEFSQLEREMLLQAEVVEETAELSPAADEQEIAAIIDESFVTDELLFEAQETDEVSVNQEDADISIVNELPIESEMPEMPDDDSAVIISEQNEEPELMKLEQAEETTINNEDNISGLEEEKINQLIDQGFGLKNEEHFMDALDCFAAALDLSENEDLSFLLLMEMVNILKDRGMYAQAEQLLFTSIGKAHRRTDIINEIDRQLSYIRLLSVELDRLGLANTPISEVPRWVRINVAEIVEG